MVAQHLELPLASMFADRAQKLAGFTLPDTLHGSWLTPRNIQLLNVQKVLRSLHQKYKMETVCPQIPKFPNFRSYGNIDALQRELLLLAVPWREANGVFTYSKLQKHQWGKTMEETMRVAKDYTDDQWFFGVIFDVHKTSWTMTVSIDKTATQEEVNALDPVRPVYTLPKPQDVDETYRKALKERGRTLPSFKLWVDQNRHFFPDEYENDPAFDFTVPQPSARSTRRKRSIEIPSSDDEGDNDTDFFPSTAAMRREKAGRFSGSSMTSPAKRHQVTDIRADATFQESPAAAANVYPFAYTAPTQVPQHRASLPASGMLRTQARPQSLVSPSPSMYAPMPSPAITDASAFTPTTPFSIAHLPAAHSAHFMPQAQVQVADHAPSELATHLGSVNVATSADGAADLALTHLTTLMKTSEVYPHGFSKEYSVPGGYAAKIVLKKL